MNRSAGDVMIIIMTGRGPWALKSSPDLSESIRTRLLESFSSFGLADADVIIPVPLSKKRYLERGYNQAAVIGSFLSVETAIQFDGASLERTVHTPMHRVGMDRKAREITVKKAFSVVRPRLLQGRSVVLVDDVLTSGATASACARILKKNGSGRVSVFTLARAVYS